MEVIFNYEDLIARCEQLSSFEAEGKVDAAGQSRYLEIHINEVDKQLVQQYIEQARGIIEERLERMLDGSVTITPDVFYKFDAILDNPILAYDSFSDNQLQGAAVAFVRVYWDKNGGNDLYRFAHYRESVDNSFMLDRVVPEEYNNPSSKLYNVTDKKFYRWNDAKSDIVIDAKSDIVIDEVINGFQWTLRTDTRWKQNAAFERHATEAIVAYTMSAWLSDKLPERVTFYDTLFNNSLNLAIKNIFTKQPPKYE